MIVIVPSARLYYELITVALPARCVFDVLSAIRCASREHTHIRYAGEFTCSVSKGTKKEVGEGQIKLLVRITQPSDAPDMKNIRKVH